MKLSESILNATKVGCDVSFRQTDSQTLVLEVRLLDKAVDYRFNLLSLELARLPEQALAQQLEWMVDDLVPKLVVESPMDAKAKSCIDYHDGRCSRNGYPPFDCKGCRSYTNQGVW